jgi:hypothetical protein
LVFLPPPPKKTHHLRRMHGKLEPLRDITDDILPYFEMLHESGLLGVATL